MAGETAGPYRLLDLAGEGRLGVVWRAIGHDGRKVAIKLLKPESAAHADFRRDRASGGSARRSALTASRLPSERAARR
jgi:RIO-like serine/threonine protein kinase